MSQSKQPTNTYTIAFVIVLCFSCSLVLSILASVLREPQEKAQRIELSQQMLLSAKAFSHQGYLQMVDDEENLVPAKHVGDGLLEPGSTDDIATGDDILAVYKRRITSFLVDAEGNRTTFEEQGIDEEEYLAENAKDGYAGLPYKLVYEVSKNPRSGQSETEIDSYIIPVNGFGLWDRIKGFLAIEPDGVTVRGISWYEHKETPGLGAEIAAGWWQDLFTDKKIFLLEPDQPVDLRSAPIGITVIRGNVKEMIGTGPKADASVDGMAGATLTGVGVTKAYKDILEQYRGFLVQLNEKSR